MTSGERETGYEFRFPETAPAVLDALADDPFYATLASGALPGQSKQSMLCYIDYSLAEAERHGVLSLAPQGHTGAAAWSTPLDADLNRRVGDRKRAFISSVMGESCRKIYDDITRFMHDATRPFVAEDSWYLSIIGVSPQSQGQGIGRRMMLDVLRRSDEARVPSYLETFSPRNRNFYVRLGYREAAVIHEPRSNAAYAVMVRDPAVAESRR